MKIIIFGHTGMLGKALVKHLNNSYEIVGISRNANSNLSIENHLWQDLSNVLKKNKFDIAINLCGESIGQPWHQWSRQKIYDSRVNVTKNIVNLFSNKDIHLINAGGVGIYDSTASLQNKTYEENINPAGFLQKLAFDWEKEANKHPHTTILRTAVVMKKNDGVLKKMLLGKQFKLLSQFGNGKNPFPWISIDDWCHAVEFIIQKKLLGPINLTSPHLSNYNDVMDTLCKKTRACKIIIPNMVVKTLLGEMGESLFLTGSHALPNTLIKSGFEFKQTSIEKVEI